MLPGALDPVRRFFLSRFYARGAQMSRAFLFLVKYDIIILMEELKETLNTLETNIRGLADRL